MLKWLKTDSGGENNSKRGKKKKDKKDDSSRRKSRVKKSKKSKSSEKKSEDVYTNKPKRKLLDIGLFIPSQTAKYTILSVLGSGGFGDVYKVQKEGDPDCYALKTEDATNTESRLRRLKIEAEVLSECGKNQNDHFLSLVDRGRTDDFKFIVMPVVWLTLDKIRSDVIKSEQYSRNCAHKICGQMVEAVRDLHGIHYLHRDLKPANFAAGLTDAKRGVVYILDFGICRRYVDANGKLIPPRAKVSFMGTPRFAPRCAHSMNEQSRKDDLESLCYVMVDIFHNAIIPWRGQRDRILLLQLKDNFVQKRGPIAAAAFTKLPAEFENIMKYVDTLTYEQCPMYDYILEEIMRPVKNCVQPMDWIGFDPEAKKMEQQMSDKAEEKRIETHTQPSAENIEADPMALTFGTTTGFTSGLTTVNPPESTIQADSRVNSDPKTPKEDLNCKEESSYFQPYTPPKY